MPTSSDYLQSLFGLEGQTAVVIGGAGVLGGALCRGLVGAGAHVVVADVTDDADDRVLVRLAAHGERPPDRLLAGPVLPCERRVDHDDAPALGPIRGFEQAPLFEHDAERGLGRVVRQGRSYGYQPLDTPPGRA